MDVDILDDPVLVNNIKDPSIDVISHASLVRDFYVMDDNLFPYKKMRIGWADSESDVDYGSAELKYCVVPLYNRMQLVYNEVYERFRTWMKEKAMDWDTPCVSRIYITSANSLKSEAIKAPDMNDMLVDIILKLSLPRFVWCIDLSTFEEYKKGLTSGRIIVDTTAPTLDEEPWILRHDRNRIEYMDIDERISFSNKCESVKTTIIPYKLYRHNLIECRGESGEKRDG